MERLKALWYRIVASGLLSELFEVTAERDAWKHSFKVQVGLLVDANKSLQAEVRFLKTALEASKAEISALRASDPMIHALDNVRHTAAQGRIRDLEHENLVLQKRLREHEGR